MLAHEASNNQTGPRQAARKALERQELPNLIRAAEDLLASLDQLPPAKRQQWQRIIDNIKDTQATHKLNRVAQDMDRTLKERFVASVTAALAAAGNPMSVRQVVRQMYSQTRTAELEQQLQAATAAGAHSPGDYVAWSQTLADQSYVLSLLPPDLPGAATLLQRAAALAKTAW